MFRFAFHFPRRFLPPETRSIILKLSKREEFAILEKMGRKFYIILTFNLRPRSVERKIHLLQTFDYPITQRIPFSSVSRNFGQVLFSLRFSLLLEKKIDSIVHLSCINITLVESWMEFTATARRMREALQGSAPLFSLLSFFLSCGFLSDLLEPPRGRERIVN